MNRLFPVLTSDHTLLSTAQAAPEPANGLVHPALLLRDQYIQLHEEVPAGFFPLSLETGQVLKQPQKVGSYIDIIPCVCSWSHNQ